METTASVQYFSEQPTTLPDIHVWMASWVDFDNDEDLDVLLSGSLYRNDGNGVFALVFSGLPYGDRNAVAWADYNNDGWLDVLIAGGGVSRIYRNNGTNGFSDIEAGLHPLTAAAGAWGDWDNDGDLDLLLTGNAGGGRFTMLYRNDGQDRFSALDGRGLPGVDEAALAWGDFDADGRLDVLLAGGLLPATFIAGVYRNVGTGFVALASTLTGVREGAVAWGDYDSNGTLDAMVAGFRYGTYLLNVYRNNGDATFTDIGVGLQGIANGTAKWADFDNDGDLDILLGGMTVNYGDAWITRIYRNNGTNFSDLPTILPDTIYTLADWGDYDRDGDLDILLAGRTSTEGIVRLYRNNISKANSRPPGPIGLASEPLPDNDVLLRWNAVTDNDQPGHNGLSYSLRMGTTPGAGNIIFPHASLRTGLRRLPERGAIVSNAWRIYDLPRGTYYWSVQAIDGGLAGSPFVSEATFTITNARPTIGGLSNVVTIPNRPASPIDFLVGDLETPAGDLVLTAISSDQSLVPNANIVFGGSESNRTVTITPAADRSGSATVTIVVTDASGWSAHVDLAVSVEQFTLVRTFPLGSGITVAWGDYDNDNDLDLLLVGLGSTQIQRNDGNDVFIGLIAGEDRLSDGASAWADFDKDGYVDFVQSGSIGGGSSSYSTSLHRNNGNASFTKLGIPLLGVWKGSLAWSDYDNDGDLDLLLAGSRSFMASATRIYRNDLSDQNLADTRLVLPGVDAGAALWGDFDGDGWVDVLVTGTTNASSSGAMTRLYRNIHGESFVAAAITLPPAMNSALAAGDFDRDGDLDVALSGGNMTSNRFCSVFRNDGQGLFTEFAVLTGVNQGSLSWGDYDQDGWPDLLVTGITNELPNRAITRLYRNAAGSGFELAPITWPDYFAGSAAWGDYDNNGSLDLVITGSAPGGGWPTRLYRNNQPRHNTVAAPIDLAATVTDNDAVLTWNPPPGVAASALTYNVRLGTTPGGMEILVPHAAADGYRRIPEFGNAGGLTRKILRGLRRGSYYWNVQAVDSSFRGSFFSTQGVFNVTSFLPPTLGPIADLAGIEDAPRLNSSLSGIRAGDIVSNLTFTVTNSNAGLITNVSTLYVGPQTTGQMVIHLVTNAFGTASVSVSLSGMTVQNEVLSTTETFSVTVSPVNDAPIPIWQFVTGKEDSLLPITLRGSDVDGDPLTYSVVSLPTHGVLSGSGGELLYQPHTNYFGTDALLFRANDGFTNSSGFAIVVITLEPVAEVAQLRMHPLVDQSFALDIQGEPHQQYAIEVSENLVDWTHLQTGTASAGGLLSLTIMPEGGRLNFYRTRVVSAP